MTTYADSLTALADPTRRTIFERVAERPSAVGELANQLPVTRPAVSQHLKVLRDSGLATVRPSGTRRLYAVNSAPLREVDAWLDPFRRFWTPHLEALATELARGKRERRLAKEEDSAEKGSP